MTTGREPLIQEQLADPWVWESGGLLHATGTPSTEVAERLKASGRILPHYTSIDGVVWEWQGGLVRPFPHGFQAHNWAPEVRVLGNRLELLWTSGNEIFIADNPADRLHLYVAFADDLVNPVFEPCPVPLCHGNDGHILPFEGVNYLYWCTDRTDDLQGCRIAAGVLDDAYRIVPGSETTILQPSGPEYDTHQYGYVAEGMYATVIEGRIWMLFSRGDIRSNYETVSMWADHPLGPFEIDEPATGGFHLASGHGIQVPGHPMLCRHHDQEMCYFHAVPSGKEICDSSGRLPYGVPFRRDNGCPTLVW